VWTWREKFSERSRDECLNAACVRNLADAREKISRWREKYNCDRLHRSGSKIEASTGITNAKIKETFVSRSDP